MASANDTRLLFTALLCVLASSQATAQNWLCQGTLVEAWLESGAPCPEQ